MSETCDVLKKPPEEPQPAGVGDDKQSEDNVEVYRKDSDISMLEDEEMPTYSSISSSIKPNNSVSTHELRMIDIPSERERSPSPEPSEDQDNESVYVVSSTADTDRNQDDIEDEEEENYDSEDMNEEDDIDEEDEGDDMRDDYSREQFERDSDDFEADRFERASDDFVLRQNSDLKPFPKERSQSLQDLATVEARFDRRRNLRFQWERNYPGFKKNPYNYQSTHSKPRYDHVESKVKRYIQDIKEQNKVSRYKDYMEGNNAEYVNSGDSSEIKQKTAGPKPIKEYAEKVIKELEGEECSDDQNPTYATLELVENGQESASLKLSNDRLSTDSATPMEIDCSPISKQNQGERLGKANGIIELRVGSEITFTPIEKAATITRMNEQMNGTEPTSNLVNLRTLSYDEYMRGTSHEEEVEIDSNDICLISPKKRLEDPLNSEFCNSNNTNSIQITNVRKQNHDSEILDIYENNVEDSVKMIHAETEKIKAENSEVLMLRATLNQRNAQFDCLQVAYQKTLAENIAMKQELENLKKMMKERDDYESREKKSASIQTDESVGEDFEKNILTAKNGQNKISSSINSAVSSIHYWSESACSPAISVASPDVRNVLNSDESSVFDDTPKKPPRTFSKAFITSSRILQTLSNITQGKTNINSPLVRDLKHEEAQNDQAKANEDSLTSGTATNPKKRKATDMLEAPPFAQPFKIPHTSATGRKKLNQDVGSETLQLNGLASKNENCMENSKETVGEDTNMKKKDLGDGLKYFVYRDDENSKDRSFLIQAEDPGKISNKGTVRECGPYLLGNLEVRMTEVNGTINIWGKEINLESSQEEFEISGKSAELKSGLSWQKAPQSNLINSTHIVCSTEKKSRFQTRLNDPNVSKLSHTSGSTIPKCSPQANEQSCQRRSSLSTDDNYNCSSGSHCLFCSGCKHVIEGRKYNCRSCNASINYGKCGCSHTVGRHECYPCSKVQGCVGEFRRHSFSSGCNENFPSRYSNHCLNTANKFNSKHQTTYCQSFHDEEENCQHNSKHCHLPREFTHSCSSNHAATHIECKESCASSCYQNRNSSTQNEDDPLISAQQSSEAPEVRKRRLSGKRVRGMLMDLLKGCGDCRTPNPMNISKSSLRAQDPGYITPCPPEIIVTSCSPRASCSDQSQMMEKNRCCDTCSRRIEMTTEIEAQLEFFRVEMERLRSRSDALLEKLNMLKSTDVN